MKKAYGIFRTSEGYEIWEGSIMEFSDTGIKVKYSQLLKPYKYRRKDIGRIVFMEQQDAEVKKQEMQINLEDKQYADQIRDEI